MRSLSFFLLSIFLILGCASSAPPEPTSPTQDSRCTPDGCQTSFDVGPGGEEAMFFPENGERPKARLVCATPYGAREEADLGELNSYRSGWEPDRDAQTWLKGDVETLCLFREGCEDRDDSACVDFQACCTLGEAVARPPEQMQQ